MSHYAKVHNGIVEQVIVAEAEFFTNGHFVDTSPAEWIQTSYNTHGGIHYGQDGKPDGGIALRGNYAGIGMIYDSVNDVFYTKQPYPSWTLNNTTWIWEAPVAYPNDGKTYVWDESTLNWTETS
jgi:hypothetical protein